MTDDDINLDGLDLLSEDIYSTPISDEAGPDMLAQQLELEREEDETVYEPGSDAYRKARKRRQNRESVSRSRQLKHNQILTLHKTIKELTSVHSTLQQENRALKVEHKALAGQLKGKEDEGPKKRLKTSKKMSVPSLIALLLLSCCGLVGCFASDRTGGVGEGRRLLGWGETQDAHWGQDWYWYVAGLAIGVVSLDQVIRWLSPHKQPILPI